MAFAKKVNHKSKAEEWMKEDQLMLLECWMRDGYTFQDVANRIGISSHCLGEWREKYPEIDEALKKGKEITDYKVENALLKAALGYKTKETEITIETAGLNKSVVNTIRKTTEKEVAPNVLACQVWLYNRLPDKWKRNRDKLIELEDEDSTIQVSVVRADKSKSEDEDEINDKIEIKSAKTGEKTKEKEDLDYWPEDWEEEVE